MKKITTHQYLISFIYSISLTTISKNKMHCNMCVTNGQSPLCVVLCILLLHTYNQINFGILPSHKISFYVVNDIITEPLFVSLWVFPGFSLFYYFYRTSTCVINYIFKFDMRRKKMREERKKKSNVNNNNDTCEMGKNTSNIWFFVLSLLISFNYFYLIKTFFIT